MAGVKKGPMKGPLAVAGVTRGHCGSLMTTDTEGGSSSLTL